MGPQERGETIQRAMKDNVDTTGSTGLRANERPDRILFTVFVKIPFILTVSIVTLTAGALLGGYLNVTQGLPTVSELRNQDPWTMATVYGKGEVYAGMPARKKITPVELSDIPEHVIHAFIAAEDPRFFVHGCDFSCTAVPVFWKRLWGKPICCFGYTIRGYMIPEQVARMYVPRPFPGPKSIFPLLRTAIMSYRIEHAWAKERILYVYLNRLYLGEQCYGVEAAAQHYFGKSVQNLTLAEAALIAG
jgi:penicillin-binding protein 1A